ncbi:hypothetical protein DICPUDRAFT_152790 [Dictyostelium purpureum]|uniref:Uncharacterized protein n=1 Tax=Dictyostelium purpureum TaxID=5786 RepID=F0ZMA1_DICPU|nr:uncharacterized protein DICPUDRAFT_152790 [Dictyostelium purpureum]EGC34922.1 hypothetical protein DICPUDRAFT_152790 [Dictyostelium purpureum]|eukprot:XP_003288555.1 hypothetical protein DICPUDRAFT_152790 [Dictyostelium purpureum]
MDTGRRDMFAMAHESDINSTTTHGDFLVVNTRSYNRKQGTHHYYQEWKKLFESHHHAFINDSKPIPNEEIF